MPDITWELFEQQVEECRLCPLCRGIRHKVPGQGDRNAPLMLIGEGPGQTEDEEGLAFVGAAGQLLTKMLEAIQLPRERVYICNIVKCRPPNNRVPTPEEAEACRIHLRMQTWLVKPKVIVLLGSTAAKNILDPEVRITRERLSSRVCRDGGAESTCSGAATCGLSSFPSRMRIPGAATCTNATA